MIIWNRIPVRRCVALCLRFWGMASLRERLVCGGVRGLLAVPGALVLGHFATFGTELYGFFVAAVAAAACVAAFLLPFVRWWTFVPLTLGVTFFVTFPLYIFVGQFWFSLWHDSGTLVGRFDHALLNAASWIWVSGTHAFADLPLAVCVFVVGDVVAGPVWKRIGGRGQSCHP